MAVISFNTACKELKIAHKKTLNIAIQESKDIEDIQVGEGIMKLCAFADDLTIYVCEKCEISSRIKKSHQDVWRHLWLEIK